MIVACSPLVAVFHTCGFSACQHRWDQSSLDGYSSDPVGQSAFLHRNMLWGCLQKGVLINIRTEFRCGRYMAQRIVPPTRFMKSRSQAGSSKSVRFHITLVSPLFWIRPSWQCAGNWPTNARPVLNKVSQLYSIFFIVYVTIIVFALIRVISAIFLKDTLDAAQNDAEHMVVEKMQKKAVYVRKLEQLFLAIDNTGSGMITEERLTKILTNPKVAALFQTLDLDVHESAALFNLLDDGDGEVTMEEFIDGVMRCKGPARAIDQVAMHAELKQLSRKLGKLLKKVRQSRATSKSHQVFSAASSAIAGAIPRKQHTLSAFLLDSVDAAGLRKNLKAPFP